jgi:hypothetical protein
MENICHKCGKSDLLFDLSEIEQGCGHCNFRQINGAEVLLKALLQISESHTKRTLSQGLLFYSGKDNTYGKTVDGLARMFREEIEAYVRHRNNRENWLVTELNKMIEFNEKILKDGK